MPTRDTRKRGNEEPQPTTNKKQKPAPYSPVYLNTRSHSRKRGAETPLTTTGKQQKLDPNNDDVMDTSSIITYHTRVSMDTALTSPDFSI